MLSASDTPDGAGRKWQRILVFVLLLVAGLIGTIARVEGAHDWKEIDGDENLFVLTAREFAQHGRLFYPVKYEFRAEVPYKTFASPATQHPPLYPLLGGIVAALAGTLKTFNCLKGISCTAGLLCMFLVWRLARRLAGEEAGVVALAIVAISVTMIFYSAKASVYMLLACTNVGVLSVLYYLPELSKWRAALLGALCALGLLLHSCMFATVAGVAVVLLFNWRRWRTLHLPIMAAAFFVVLLPYFAFNFYYLKSPFASYSTTYFYMINRLTTPRQIDGNLVHMRVQKPLGVVLPNMARSTAAAAVYFAKHVALNMGIGVMLLAAAGLIVCWRRHRMVFAGVLLLIIFQVGISSLVGIYRTRFSVPVLPLLIVMAGCGAGALLSGKWFARLPAAALTALALWQQGYTFVVDHDHFITEANLGQQQTYQKMRKLADRMATELKPGVILGAAKALDGGLETNYWLPWPYVHGREMYGPKWTQLLARDFNVSYVWCDTHNVGRVNSWLKDYAPIMSNEQFVLLGRKPRTARRGTVATAAVETTTTIETTGTLDATEQDSEPMQPID
jgi:4-amino-4-deoxy-L-arabinose transferase-like glycosyltransferase